MIDPYGGRLVSLLVSPEPRPRLIERANRLPSIRLSPRSLCDLELLATGAFSPLDRFMGRADYRSVVHTMRLADGRLFPIPVTLPVPDDWVAAPEVALRGPGNDLLAVLSVEEVFEWDLEEETREVLGTSDPAHPLVAEMHAWGPRYVSGPLEVLALPARYDFADLRGTPEEVRVELAARGHERVVAFQTRNPLHRAHEELITRAAAAIDGAALIHPVVGLTKPGDIDHFTRVRGYRVIADRYLDARRTLLRLLPLAMRMAGPREAVWHAIIRRNFGATHLIVGRDHAGPGLNRDGKPFYDPDAAQALVATVADELGVAPVGFRELVYLPDEDRYEDVSRVSPGTRVLSISGSQVRNEYLATGRALPEWFTRPEMARLLADASPPLHRRGFCVWFTGLSGAGKSTIAEILTVLLLEAGRQSTVLDGDVVRTHLSAGLGFDRADRDRNVRRIAFVAGEVVRHHGVAICAAVSPYEATREECRAMVGADHFVLVHVDTPLTVCEQRDSKGLYARARRGELTGMTGIDDPYESPGQPDVVVGTVGCTPEESARTVWLYLLDRGFVEEAARRPVT